MFDSVNGTNVQKVANLYSVYQNQHNFVGPADVAALKTFIAAMPEIHLKNFRVDPGKIDELFIGERDKKEIKIRFGLKAKPRGGPVPIAFEQDGVDGKFQVAFSSYQFREVEKQEYDELWAGKRDEEVVESNRGEPRR